MASACRRGRLRRGDRLRRRRRPVLRRCGSPNRGRGPLARRARRAVAGHPGRREPSVDPGPPAHPSRRRGGADRSRRRTGRRPARRAHRFAGWVDDLFEGDDDPAPPPNGSPSGGRSPRRRTRRDRPAHPDVRRDRRRGSHHRRGGRDTPSKPAATFASVIEPWMPAVPTARRLTSTWFCPGVPADRRRGHGR